MSNSLDPDLGPMLSAGDKITTSKETVKAEWKNK